jgi:ABC-type sugar transport system substrate-binding protein
MRDVLKKPEYAKIKLVTVAYGDDQSDKSYREALGLLRSYPNLKAIISPSTVGINAASKAVVDEKLVGKVYVTGLGLPSEMAGHRLRGHHGRQRIRQGRARCEGWRFGLDRPHGHPADRRQR